MKLRKPCEHGRYDDHPYFSVGTGVSCPGGVFLPDDTLIIEKVDGEWPESVRRVTWQWDKRDHVDGSAFLDALSVWEATEVDKNQLGMW